MHTCTDTNVHTCADTNVHTCADMNVVRESTRRSQCADAARRARIRLAYAYVCARAFARSCEGWLDRRGDGAYIIVLDVRAALCFMRTYHVSCAAASCASRIMRTHHAYASCVRIMRTRTRADAHMQRVRAPARTHTRAGMWAKSHAPARGCSRPRIRGEATETERRSKHGFMNIVAYATEKNVSRAPPPPPLSPPS